MTQFINEYVTRIMATKLYLDHGDEMYEAI